MNFWPFISIFVSLVLILLFRRIDKRIINFNKFKKYAEKLSSDFNIFFNQKKEDIFESIHDLDSALKKAAQVLAKIEMADVSLKSNYGEIQNKRDELITIRSELAELTNVKKDISAEISKIEKNLPPLKKLSKRIRKMGVDVVRNEKALKNASTILPGIEKKAREETEKVLSEAGRRVLVQAKELFAPIIKEYSESLEFLKSSHGSVVGKFRKELQQSTDLVDRRLEELNSSIAVCESKITSFESDTVGSLREKITELDSAVIEVNRKIEKAERESIRTFLKKAEDEYKNYANLLEKTQSAYKGNLFMKIEERAKDLSTYIARLEGRVQNLLDDVKKETDRYGDVLHLKIKTHEGEADILKNRIIAGINEEANKGLLKIKPIASEMNEKLLAYKEEFSSILGQVKAEYKSRKETMDNEIISFKEGIEQHKVSIINQIDSRVRDTARKLTEVNNRLEEGIREATDDVGRTLRVQIKEYEESITSLDGSIGDLQIIANTGQEMIEKRIETVFRNYQPDIEDKIKKLKQATEESFSAEREKLVQRIDDIISVTKVELDNREQEIKGLLSTIEVTINSSGEELQKHEDLIKENVEMFKIDARQELLR
ncbi:MAG TPA: hypothetical protein ENI15_05430, partial [Spirochaetes bacterium]|nr:hypothetical protein [Spirochaetota bacterium]